MHTLQIVFLSLLGILQSGEDEQFRYDAAAPAAGTWIGTTTYRDVEAFGAITISAGQSGWDADGTILRMAIKNDDGVVEKIDNSECRVQFESKDRRLSWAGSLGEDKQVWNGDLIDVTGDVGDGEIVGHFEFHRTADPLAIGNSRSFVGSCSGPGGAKIDMAILLGTTPAGNTTARIDIPMMGLKQYPLSNVRLAEGLFAADLLGAKPIAIHAECKQDQLNGTFEQGALSLSMTLEVDRNYVYRDFRRPQEPKPPFPYRQRELKAKHPDGHVLAGTLTLPDPNDFGPGPYPAAILISGGGQEDRDCTALGHKFFLVIADYLTRRGIAVMRFDDRGVGESVALAETPVGNHATTQEIATDTLAVYKMLRQVDEIDPDEIGLIGHSEGGAIAPLVCQDDKSVAYAVLMAAPGIRGDQLFRQQYESLWRLKGANEQQIQDCSALFARFQSAVVETPGSVEIRNAAIDLVAALRKASLATSNSNGEDSDAELAKGFLQYDSRWWQFMFAYDPSRTLANVRCPLLAINGTQDCQVEYRRNLRAIEQAARPSGVPIAIRQYEGRNHLFQPCETGAPDEYAKIETTIDEQVLSDVADWIHSTLAK